MNLGRRLLHYAIILLILQGVYFRWSPEVTHAATIVTISDTQTSTNAGSTTDHNVEFKPATTSLLQQINIEFFTGAGGSGGKPAGLSLTGVSLGTLSGLGSGWSLDLTNASSGVVSLTRASSVSVSAGTDVIMPLNDVVNSNIGDCTNTGTLTDTCYVDVITYSDAGSTVVDSGETTYSITEDPYLDFAISGVSSGTTHNGITTNGTTTESDLPFGALASGIPIYLAQELTISTNAPHGYTVNMYDADNLTGEYGTTTISPFGAVGATWSNPVAWTTPFGTTPNTDTGWFGANTTDTRVTGWSSAASKFGPVSPIEHPVAQSTTDDRSGSTIYVTYVLGINDIQPSDTYVGQVIYDVESNY